MKPESDKYTTQHGLPEIGKRVVPHQCSEQELETVRLTHKRLFVLAMSSLKRYTTSMNKDNLGFALFSNDGCLFKLVGSTRFLKWAESQGITEGGLWSDRQLGPNAVTEGIKLEASVSMSGSADQTEFLSGLAIHFTPVFAKWELKKETSFGGIAAIGPAEMDDPVWRALILGSAREIAMQLSWWSAVDMITGGFTGYGFFSIHHTERCNRIFYANRDIYDVLNIPHTDLFWKDLSSIIDNCPENQQFWRLLNDTNEVDSAMLTLVVMGTPQKVICDINRFEEKVFGMRGSYIKLNTRERINTLVSRHVGNTARYTFSHVVGESEQFQDVVQHARAAALSDTNILLLGESGVGKEVIAQSIHNASRRNKGPFVAVNCAAFPHDLISSELFGYNDGAFTGAKRGGNVGKFEMANKGTIFLDEIGDMPLDLQAVLLRVIEQKSYSKIGSSRMLQADVRIIAATNANLTEKIQKRKFREDLFYRLGIIRLTIPALWERKDDIPILAEHFIRVICNRLKKPLVKLAQETREYFVNYTWPGNLREMQNLLEGIIQIHDCSVIDVEMVRNYIQDGAPPLRPVTISPESVKNVSPTNFPDIRAKVPDSREVILRALKENHYNKTKTAKALGIARRTLYRRLERFGL